MAKQKPRRSKRKHQQSIPLSYDHLMIKDKSRKSDLKKNTRDRKFKERSKVAKKSEQKSERKSGQTKSKSKQRVCSICQEVVRGMIKLHLARVHFKEKLMKKYRRAIKDRKCCLCEQDFKSRGPAAMVDHIGSFHDKVYDFC